MTGLRIIIVAAQLDISMILLLIVKDAYQNVKMGVQELTNHV